MDKKTEAITSLKELSLGKATEYRETYTPSLLQAVPRSMNRQEINVQDNNLPFHGCDRWNGYELSWLNLKGKPQVAILQCEIPASSANLIESKSFKLYLNSFNQSQFSDFTEVATLLTQDLSACAGETVQVKLVPPTDFAQQQVAQFDAHSIDSLDIDVNNYALTPALLSTENVVVKESLCSDLLKSNCLITNQPDWGSVFIRYEGQQINHESLLRYLISFRQHNEFHEQCVERIFCDLMQYCKPSKLTVYARYTRRGGLDINPFRSNFEQIYSEVRLARQ
ncbi:NADPH-dependent 7-cyano-7-deazaguanine reductase QueF [Paraglaciecola aquimarina]|uniref:NADPH-dependent 7-cyano-7-deazaguanine reductase n=1 Tax=Paraglaciecola aquimarina TaxID=1235557 RepID=A0ABU3T1E4_9ALTE|nr:NADPH-dependent 7-cyano-7-deazaguanine reductase QueF [Paraglaciecola aquimarina]MDU0356095.1 NADPH-dependent 7-cyano-7-deazaguanine reductase QueF [Paraglaciecola aquimarina]